MRTRLRLHLLPAVFAIALVGSGCDVNIGEHGFSMDLASGKATDEWRRTYTLPASGRLEITNMNGAISATPAEGGAVEVRAERIAKASSDEAAQEFLKKIQIVETATADHVRIETKAPKGSFGRGGHEVRYFVKVPRGLSMNFETVNGGVRLENIDGQIVASTTNGGVRGSGLKGSVKASTTNGGVEIEMASLNANVELETTNGGIRLRLPRDAKATIDAHCVNGGISMAEGWNGLEQTEKSRREFRGTLNGGGATVSVETVNGGIRIGPSGPRAETN
jgi:hypothetical protein